MYKKDVHPQELIEMAKKGYTISQTCSEWGISRDTLYQWNKDKTTKPDFHKAFKVAKEHREVWWIKFGINLMAGKVKGGNATAYVWMTKNILKWKDMPEDDDGDDDIEDLIFE